MATAEKKKNLARIVTGKVRLSFVHLVEPDEDDNGNLSYRAMILVPKSDKATLKKIQTAIGAATMKFANGDKAKAQKLLKHPKWHKPLRDPEAEDLEGEAYTDMYFFTAKSRDRPGMLLKNGARVETDELIHKHFYSGAYVNCSLSFFPFDQKGNKGVAVALNNIIKNCDGERLDGRVAAEDELAELIDEDNTDGLDDDDSGLGLDDDDDMGLGDDSSSESDDDEFDLDL